MNTTKSSPIVDLHQNRGSQITGTVMGLSVFAGFIVVGRLVARKIKATQLQAPDYAIVAGLVGAWGESGLDVYLACLGLGKHVEVVPSEKIQKMFQVVLAGELVYSITLPLIKISILLFYRQLFPGRGIRIATNSIIASVIVWGFVVFFGSIFSCHPISGFWNKALDPPPTCISSKALAIGISSYNIATDIIILCLPIGKVWNLQMSMQSKVAVSGIFLLGGFVVVASTLRLKFLFDIEETDVTWSWYGVAVWSAIELNVAVVSACLPTMRPLVQAIVASPVVSCSFDAIGKLRPTNGKGNVWPMKRTSQRQGNDEEFHRLPDVGSKVNNDLIYIKNVRS
ncbi:hypothetical protein MMC14_003747 [Varicellaria rhodocarpa]|nr:hypothetical protein [Varicellaria rhodocarpa]